MDLFFQALVATHEDSVALRRLEAATEASFREGQLEVGDEYATAIPLHIVSRLERSHCLLAPLVATVSRLARVEIVLGDREHLGHEQHVHALELEDEHQPETDNVEGAV